MTVGRSSRLPPFKQGRLVLLATLLLVIVMAAVAAVAYLRLQEDGKGGTDLLAGAAQGSVEDAAIATYLRAIAQEPSRSDGYRNLSMAYQRQNRTDEALAVWEQAAQANPGQTWPWLELGNAYAMVGLPIKARDAYYQAASLDPQDGAANQALLQATADLANTQAIKHFLAEHQPGGDPSRLEEQLQLLNQPLGNGWTFVGWHADTAALAAGKKAAVWTFWKSATPDMLPEAMDSAWRPVAEGIWGHLAVSTNLQANGNFEGELENNQPVGFPMDTFAADAMTRQLRRVQRADQFTTAGVLANNAADLNTSFAGAVQPVAEDTAYLVYAEAYNEGGNPSVNWAWSGEIDDKRWPLEGRAQPWRMANGWQEHQGLAVPPPGATGMHSQLRNTETAGTVLFDNVVVAAVKAPAPLWPIENVAEAVKAAEAAAKAAAEAEQETKAALEAKTAAEAAASAAVAPQENRSARFAAQMNRYSTYPAIVEDAEWQAGLDRIGPLIRVNQTLSDGWLLQGYSTDETRLAAGEPAPLVLYWQGPEGAVAGPAEAGWMAQAPGKWLQFLPNATSGIVNGSFEAGLDGWTDSILLAPASSRQLAVTTRRGYTTTVAVLTNTLAFSSTSLVTAPQPLTTGHVYLQAGWMRSENARGYLGHYWSGPINPALAPFDRYVVSAGSENDWLHFAGIAEPLPGAEQVQVQLLNYQSGGAVSFDNIVFVPIPRPLALAQMQRTDAKALLTAYTSNAAVVKDESWLAAVAAAGPMHLLDQAMEEGWSFIGFSADEEALVAGAVTPVFYFWQGPLGEIPGAAQEGWYSIDAGLWLQIERVGNLLSSGQRLALPGQASTAPVTVRDDLFYLQMALVRSLDEARMSIGVTWQDEAPAGSDTTTQWIAIDIRAADWKQVVGLLQPPPGATEAEALLASGDGNGTAEAEALLLLPVTPPVLPTPAVGMRASTPL